jgi:lysophospholipase L1-like esterase
MALAVPLGPASADAGQPPGGAPATASAATPCPTVALPALHLPATRAALRSGKPITILAFGSSSTEGSGATTPDRTYPARLADRLRAALPGVPVEVLNRGRGGEDVVEMLARLDREVVAARPTVVIWQAGANAVMKGMDPEAFRGLMAEGIARLQATGADVVLMDSQRAPRILASPNHALFETLMQQLAEATQVPLFSRAELMRRWEAAGEPPGRLIGEDGLHHNDRGYDCVATALSRSLATALRPSSPPQMAAALVP